MDAIDVMDDFALNTGNAYADVTLTHKLALKPEYWALVEYLEKKGYLTEQSFSRCLTRNAPRPS